MHANRQHAAACIPALAAAGRALTPPICSAAVRPAALQPPPEKSVAGAVRTLQEVGALTAAEELTPLGEERLLAHGPAQHCTL